MQIDRPIAIALTLFVILLMVFFWVVPEYKTFGKLRTELGEKRAEYNAEFDYFASITRTYFDLQARQDDVKKIDDALPSNPDLGKLMYFLQRTAKENGMMVTELILSKSSPTSAAAKNNIKEAVFSVDIVGDYISLGKFIVAIEKSARLLEVANISFSSPTGSIMQSSPSLTPTQFQTQQIYNFTLQIKANSY